MCGWSSCPPPLLGSLRILVRSEFLLALGCLELRRLDDSCETHRDLASYAITEYLETRSSSLEFLVSHEVLHRPTSVCCRFKVWEGSVLSASQGLPSPGNC